MRKSKDLNACISFLKDLQSGGSVEPEKKQVIGHVVNELKRIRRKPGLKQHELYESIRSIVETLVQAFKKRD